MNGRVPSISMMLLRITSYNSFRAWPSFPPVQTKRLAWLRMRPHFERIVPVYKYLVPGLEFVEESLAYYERFFGTKIVQVPHPSMFRWLRNFTLQPPHHIALLQQALRAVVESPAAASTLEALGITGFETPDISVYQRCAEMRRTAEALNYPELA
jgi:hypothetical protein